MLETCTNDCFSRPLCGGAPRSVEFVVVQKCWDATPMTLELGGLQDTLQSTARYRFCDDGGRSGNPTDILGFCARLHPRVGPPVGRAV